MLQSGFFSFQWGFTKACEQTARIRAADDALDCRPRRTSNPFLKHLWYTTRGREERTRRNPETRTGSSDRQERSRPRSSVSCGEEGSSRAAAALEDATHQRMRWNPPDCSNSHSAWLAASSERAPPQIATPHNNNPIHTNSISWGTSTPAISTTSTTEGSKAESRLFLTIDEICM